MKCFYCQSDEKEMRPYGPKCSMVCFDCAMSTTERQIETNENFSLQLAACGDNVVIGTEAGPIPASALLSDGKEVNLLH